jgi:hypothetical protein
VVDMGWKSFWDKILDIPLDYEKGYIDGFVEGIKFYKDSIDQLYKAVLDSEKVRTELEVGAKIRRDEYESRK